MKTYSLMSAEIFHLAGWMQFVFLLLIWPLTNTCFGDPAPSTNRIPWSDNFENQYTNLTPLIGGTNGWYASSGDCIVQSNVTYSGAGAAMLPIDVTLSNKFVITNERIVRIEMYVQPQLYDGTNYPNILGTNNDSIVSTNVAAQFFVNSNGFFVVGNGTNWYEASKMANGMGATPVTNTSFTKVQINLRYKNHTWNLKAWSTNDPSTLVAHTYYVNFTSNLNTFSGFDIYNGNSTCYVDNVSVTNIDYNLLSKINGVPSDTIKTINGVQPGAINGESD